jgi:transcription initiation factor TFIID subunit 8
MEDRGAAPAGEPTAEALERRVARVVVAQSLQAAGFTSARASALDALSAVLLGYLKEAGHLAHEAAESAGRAQAALPDALVALEALGADAPRLLRYVERCYAGAADELPFAQPLPRYPVRKRPRAPPSLLETGEAAAAHVPRWAPALPDPHTYTATPAHAPAPADDRRVRLQLAEQTVGAEGAMARLADRLAPGAPADYTVAAPGRWGGPLTGPGVHARRAEEQAAALAAAPGADVALLRRGGAADAPLAPPVAYHHPPSLAPLLAPPQTDGGAEEAQQPDAAGWQLADADAPAAEAIRRVALGLRRFRVAFGVILTRLSRVARRQLPPVHAFALDAASVARAAARAARGLAPAAAGDAFALLPGRTGRQSVPYDRERLDKILARDPHSQDLLESIDDLLN